MSTLALIDYIGEVMATCSVVISRWQIRISQNLMWAQCVHCGMMYAVVSRLFLFRTLARLKTF
jgi:hypothetical protein